MSTEEISEMKVDGISCKKEPENDEDEKGTYLEMFN